MDKVKKNRKLVREILTDIADSFRRNSHWEIIEAFDEEHGQYLLFTDGWEGEHRDYGCFMHLEVKEDGKNIIQRNRIRLIQVIQSSNATLKVLSSLFAPYID